MWRNNAANVESLASQSHSTNHSMQGQDKWFWRRGHIVLFPAASFDSEDSTSCFHSWFDRCHFGRKWLGRDMGNSSEEQCRSHDERTCIRQRNPRPFHITERPGDTTTGIVHLRRKSEERRRNMFRVPA